MKKLILCALLIISPAKAKADLWGADLPLLAEIVFNTLHTMMQLQEQTSYWESQMKGIDDRIIRMRTISQLVQPSDWNQWKNPDEALRRLQKIYLTLPKQYRSEKTDELERELAKALLAYGEAVDAEPQPVEPLARKMQAVWLSSEEDDPWLSVAREIQNMYGSAVLRNTRVF